MTIHCANWGLTASLTQDKREVERMVRLMIFNMKAGNQDDHSKNFSFCMDSAGLERGNLKK